MTTLEMIAFSDVATGWISQLVFTVIKDRPNLQSVKDFLTKYPHWNQ